MWLARTGLALALALIGGVICGPARAEDGYDLWLRYRPVEASWKSAYAPRATSILPGGDSETIRAAVAELTRGIGGMLGAVPVVAKVPVAGAILVGTPETLPEIAALNLPLKGLGDEGYLVRSVRIGAAPVTVIAGNSDKGALYGAFAFLKRLQTRQPIDALDIADAPKLQLRMLNHWDNLDRSRERGYSGQSIWDWWALPDDATPRYTDYARANASIGINGVVLNNVGAQAAMLTPFYIERAAELARRFRPYGIKVYFSARFSAPIELGGLETADPLDPAVRAWWKAKADEIYAAIPNFGGFLVKANSEGQPGPQDYRRTHADGANMLAAALAPHGGNVIWRAFVYAAENPVDRAKQAFDEFKPLDGKFAANVLVQVKNGPIDFQPREPFHPLFGAMPKTPLVMEFQITKEYLGFSTHLAFLGPLYEEVLRSDTYAKGKGSTVAKVIEGKVDGHALTGMAGVANVGTDRNWSGSHFDQANWYAFGRFAWDPEAASRNIAADWAKMTFSAEPRFVAPAVDLMMASREHVVDYMTPLGLAHLMGTGHHYGPAPWVSDLARPDWNPVYYHRADATGIGFDRTGAGSNAISQYAPEVAAGFGDRARVPERLLLWFHHVGWDDRLESGATLWEPLVRHYDRGVAGVGAMQSQWRQLRPFVDPERFREVDAFLAIQKREAVWWRDASIGYFQSISKRPLPDGARLPAHALERYRELSFPYAPGQAR